MSRYCHITPIPVAMNVEEILSQKINMPLLRDVAAWASGTRENLGRLWEMAHSADRRASVNALWVLTHLAETDARWFSSIRDSMIDMLLHESDPSHKRMLLQILRKQEYGADDIRTDFLDFCMSKINSECEPYAVRCFSIYAAFRMCRHYPELIDELDAHLDMMTFQPLSPGLKSALRQTKAGIKKLRK